MNTMTRSGQLCFGLSLIAFGVIHFVFGHSPSGLMPLPEQVPSFVFYLDGGLLVLMGIGIAACIGATTLAYIAAAFFFLLFLSLGLPKEIVHPYDPGSWTGPCELLFLTAGALIVGTVGAVSSPLRVLARWLLAISLGIIGIQHFQYAQGVAGLITAWIPAKLFWAIFVGAALCALSLSLVLNKFLYWSTRLAALMFLLWVPILHAPRVAANIHTETEWTSMFVALAIGGIFLVLGAPTLPQEMPGVQKTPSPQKASV
jgi:uncharacterized membrane protein